MKQDTSIIDSKSFYSRLWTLALPIAFQSLMLAAVAADGVVHPPYLVEQIVNADGSVYETPKRPESRKLELEPRTIQLIQKGLKGVTQPGGTGAWFANLPVPVAGKTGTAENPHGQDHGWFIAYAPA